VPLDTDLECETAATKLGLSYYFSTTGPSNTENYPKGCFLYSNKVYWNIHPTGSRSENAKSVCKSVHTLDRAMEQCKAFGNEWGVDKKTNGSVVCTKNGMEWWYNCDSCDTWRLIVFISGSNEYGPGSLSTTAGSYYGGRSPCGKPETYFPYCGHWPNA